MLFKDFCKELFTFLLSFLVFLAYHSRPGLKLCAEELKHKSKASAKNHHPDKEGLVLGGVSEAEDALLDKKRLYNCADGNSAREKQAYETYHRAAPLCKGSAQINKV